MERIEELDETSDIQAVVAAVRNRADEIRGNLGPKGLWEERVERAEELMEIADRMEAAVKRERDLASLRAIHAVEMAERDARRELDAAVLNQDFLDSTKYLAEVAARTGAARQDMDGRKEGNAAKLREALVAAQDLLARIDFDADSDLDDMAAPVVAKIGQALAAPPRNCDRFATEHDANAAFDEMCAQRGGGIRACIGCKYNAGERGGLPSISHCRVAWLFDTASQEGGE